MSKSHKLVIPRKTTKLLAFNALVITGALCFLSPAAYAAIRPTNAAPLNIATVSGTQSDPTQVQLDLLQAANATAQSSAEQSGLSQIASVERDAYWATSQKTLDHRAAVAKKKAAEAKAKAEAAALKERIAALLATPATDIQAYAYKQVLAEGWDDTNFTCLVNLWNKESGWNPQAENVSSGAYGIPQALPGSKMVSMGADWKTNYKTQIDWGIWYIANSSYGTPCAAWQHSQKMNWY